MQQLDIMMQGKYGKLAGYACISFASSALHNVWISYYLAALAKPASGDGGDDVGLPSSSFYAGQFVFMLWNACNDPIFGWISDLNARKYRRIAVISAGGLAWCFAFLFTWLPLDWLSSFPVLSSIPRRTLSSVHYLAALVLYDGCLTLTEVNQGALLAETFSSTADRAEAVLWSSLAAAAGSASSYPAHLAWVGVGTTTTHGAQRDMGSFRLFALFLASSCAALFLASYTLLLGGSDAAVSSKRLQREEGVSAAAARLGTTEGSSHQDAHHGDTPGSISHGSDAEGDLEAGSAAALARRRAGHGGLGPVGGEGEEAEEGGGSERGNASEPRPSFCSFLHKLLGRPNFLLFAAFATVQALDCSLGKTLFTTLAERLSLSSPGPPHSSQHSRSLALSLSFLLPHMLVALLTPITRSRGAYTSVWVVLGCRAAILAGAWGAGFAAMLGAGEGTTGAGKESDGYTLGLLFLLLSRVSSECVCRLLYPLVLSDVIDESNALTTTPGGMPVQGQVGDGTQDSGNGAAAGDGVSKRRMGGSGSTSSSMGASVSGASAFASKLAASAAPMLGYRAVLVGDSSIASSSAASSGSLVAAVALGVPVAVVLCQAALWSKYGLRGHYLKWVKEQGKG